MDDAVDDDDDQDREDEHGDVLRLGLRRRAMTPPGQRLPDPEAEAPILPPLPPEA
jgi:hypothetical protein